MDGADVAQFIPPVVDIAAIHEGGFMGAIGGQQRLVIIPEAGCGAPEDLRLCAVMGIQLHVIRHHQVQPSIVVQIESDIA